MQGFQGMKEGLGCASLGFLTEPKPWNSGPGLKVSATCCAWGKGAVREACPAGPLHSWRPGYLAVTGTLSWLWGDFVKVFRWCWRLLVSAKPTILCAVPWVSLLWGILWGSGRCSVGLLCLYGSTPLSAGPSVEAFLCSALWEGSQQALILLPCPQLLVCASGQAQTLGWAVAWLPRGLSLDLKNWFL